MCALILGEGGRVETKWGFLIVCVCVYHSLLHSRVSIFLLFSKTHNQDSAAPDPFCLPRGGWFRSSGLPSRATCTQSSVSSFALMDSPSGTPVQPSLNPLLPTGFNSFVITLGLFHTTKAWRRGVNECSKFCAKHLWFMGSGLLAWVSPSLNCPDVWVTQDWGGWGECGSTFVLALSLGCWRMSLRQLAVCANVSWFLWPRNRWE